MVTPVALCSRGELGNQSTSWESQGGLPRGSDMVYAEPQKAARSFQNGQFLVLRVNIESRLEDFPFSAKTAVKGHWSRATQCPW